MRDKLVDITSVRIQDFLCNSKVEKKMQKWKRHCRMSRRMQSKEAHLGYYVYLSTDVRLTAETAALTAHNA